MTFTPHIPPRINAKIDLPSSKSLSNRAMLLCALSGVGSSAERISSCDDSYVMWRALRERPETVDIMAAGTAMRFLTAFFATCDGEEHILTGTERMRQRPIGVLVDALRSLGADIDYVERKGFPPLRIRGRELQGGSLSLPASVSSQYISALLMTAPLMRDGLRLTLEGDIISRPYILMTIEMMRTFGADVEWEDSNVIRTAHKDYSGDVIYPIESDWSAASYWYEIMAITPDANATIALPYLYKKSLQGDSRVKEFFEPLGVQTTFDEEHEQVILTKRTLTDEERRTSYELDLVDQPDLAQTLVVTCALLQRPFRFTGLRSLRIKETDRMDALRNELAKFGIKLGIEGDEALFIRSYDSLPQYNGTPIATYHDHRMAMAFAPACIQFPNLLIDNPEVVSKSYPHFWDDLASLA